MSAHPHHWEGTSIWPLLWVEVKYGAFPLRGTARYGSVQFTFGGFPLGTVPGTWYFFYYHLGRGSKRSVLLPKPGMKTLLITDWPEKIFITVSLNLRYETQHRSARFKSAQPAKDQTQLLFEQMHLLYQPQNGCFVVCWGSTDVPLIDCRGADLARAE